MMNKRSYAVQLFGLIEREIKRFLKVPYQTIGAPIVTTLLYLLIFGVSIGSAIDQIDGRSYISFLIPGLVALGIIKNSFENSTSSVIIGKYVNELQDLRVVPLSIIQITWGMTLSAALRGWLVGVFTYIVSIAFVLMSGQNFFPSFHIFYFLCIFTLIGLTFGCLGLGFAFKVSSFEQIGMVSSFILTPLIYLGGVFFSLDRLAPAWQTISKINPLFYLINGLRFGMTGIADASPFYSLIIALLFFVASYIFCIHELKKGQNYLR